MYNSAEISDRIKQMAKARGVPVKKVLEDVNLGANMMANMKASVPKADNLAKIADYLDCSVDYLLGREQQDEKSALPAVSSREDALDNELSPDEQRFLTAYRAADPLDKAMVLRILKIDEVESEEKVNAG